MLQGKSFSLKDKHAGLKREDMGKDLDKQAKHRAEIFRKEREAKEKAANAKPKTTAKSARRAPKAKINKDKKK